MTLFGRPFVTVVVCFFGVANAFRECSTHPGVQDIDDFKPVLLKSWKVNKATTTKGSLRAYFPRSNQTSFEIDQDGGETTKLSTLDIVMTRGPFHLNFYREATVYMLVDSPPVDGAIQPPDNGWEGLGWFQASNEVSFLTYGMGKEKLNLPKSGYVFRYKTATTNVTLPNRKEVYDNTNLISYKSRGFYVTLLAEEDGTPSPEPSNPSSVKESIVPARHCPDALHKLWAYTAHPGAQDEWVGDKKFLSWHPVVDPCYACVYNHEHGSDAEKLINGGPDFAPRYTYAAFKNHNQSEAIEGFKSVVFPYDDSKYMGAWQKRLHVSILLKPLCSAYLP